MKIKRVSYYIRSQKISANLMSFEMKDFGQEGFQRAGDFNAQARFLSTNLLSLCDKSYTKLKFLQLNLKNGLNMQ